MRLPAAWLAVALLALWTASGGAVPAAPHAEQDPQAPQATFRAATDLVRVDVSVRQQDRAVTGLSAADFEIRDNGVVQEIADISFEKLPIDVTVALDTSGSVSGSVLDQLRRSVQQLQTDLSARDRLKLLTFNMRVMRLADFATPSPVSRELFGPVIARGSTAIFDALAVALTSRVPPERRHLLMAFSDGFDSSSITEPAMLLDLARRGTTTVDVILASPLPVVANGRPISQVTPERTALKLFYNELAGETGGVVVSTYPDDNLASMFRSILEQFRSSYVISFVPRGVERRGTHVLDIRVKRSGLAVRMRRAYVWQ